MRTIWKFPLPIGRQTQIRCGPGPVVLVGADPGYGGGPAVWIEHDKPEVTPWANDRPGAALIDDHRRWFLVVGTGDEIEPEWTHVGSIIDKPQFGSSGPSYVWHVYELGRE